MKRFALPLLLAGLAAVARAWTPGDAPYAEGRLLLRFDQDVSTVAEAARVLADPRLEPVRPLVKALGIWEVELKEGWTVRQALSELDGRSGLLWAQADHQLALRQTFPNDPLWGSQWDLHNTGQSGVADADIDAPEAWDLGTGGLDGNGDEIVVAIVDGGMELTHSNLAPNLWINAAEAAGTPGVDDDGNGYVDDVNGWDGYANDGTIPTSSHGTHVAGTVGARGNDGSLVAGISWNVKLMAVAASSGQTSVISVGYGYVLDQKTLWYSSGGAQGANVVATNSSFGVDLADCESGSYPIWNDLYDAMGQVGILSAAATANANYNVDVQGDVPTSCSSDWMISVTNTTSSDVKYSSAGYGATTIDLGAPGTNTLSTYSGNTTATLTGTSMATPHVAGAVGFLHSVAGPGFTAQYNADPAAGALLLKQILLDGVDPLPSLQGVTVTGGRLNLYNAALAISQIGGASLGGTVTALSGGAPLDGATIVAQPGGRSASSDAEGLYGLVLQPGAYDVTASAYGYQDLTLPVVMPEEGDMVLDFALAAVPTALLAGVYLDGDGLPLAGGEVEALGSPLPAQLTGPDGAFAFELPVGASVTVVGRGLPGEIHEPQAADGHGYRAFDPGDADWDEETLTLPEAGAFLTLQGANRAVYDWTTIDPLDGGPGTALAFTGDDQTLPLALPFPFLYYGQSTDGLSVNANGWVAFGTTSATQYVGQPIPTAAEPNGTIAAFWEDLSPQQAVSGSVSSWHDEAGGRFVIEFHHVRQYSPSTAFESFQIVLFDPATHPTVTGDGAILLQWSEIGELDNATVGIENPAGDDGLQYFYGRSDGVGNPGGELPATNAPVTVGSAVLFTTGLLEAAPSLQPVSDLSIGWSSGTVLLDWSPAAGAASYRIEGAGALGEPWTPLATVAVPGWSAPAEPGMAIFRVIAID